MLLSSCAVCNSKKSIFTKGREVWGLLSNLRIKTLLGPLVGHILF